MMAFCGRKDAEARDFYPWIAGLAAVSAMPNSQKPARWPLRRNRPGRSLQRFGLAGR
jgi:hypothetical protein